jgi:hypothetical protein
MALDKPVYRKGFTPIALAITGAVIDQNKIAEMPLNVPEIVLLW